MRQALAATALTNTVKKTPYYDLTSPQSALQADSQNGGGAQPRMLQNFNSRLDAADQALQEVGCADYSVFTLWEFHHLPSQHQ